MLRLTGGGSEVYRIQNAAKLNRTSLPSMITASGTRAVRCLSQRLSKSTAERTRNHLLHRQSNSQRCHQHLIRCWIQNRSQHRLHLEPPCKEPIKLSRGLKHQTQCMKSPGGGTYEQGLSNPHIPVNQTQPQNCLPLCSTPELGMPGCVKLSTGSEECRCSLG